jgi:hypothetical protein
MHLNPPVTLVSWQWGSIHSINSHLVDFLPLRNQSVRALQEHLQDLKALSAPNKIVYFILYDAYNQQEGELFHFPLN